MTEHGSIATVKSTRPLNERDRDPLYSAAMLLCDVRESGDQIFKLGGWKLVEARFHREMINQDGKNVLHLSVTARLEPT